MRIDGSSTDATAGQTAQAGGAGAAPKEEFLNLLVAQLQHQNPLDPQDGAEFVAQLAQFASLEQSAETNQRLAELAAEQAAASRASLSSLVGRQISAHAGTVGLSGEQAPTGLKVDLDEPATDVRVVVYDAGGKAVRTIELGPHAPGDIDAGWDGTDDRGVPLPKGEYTIEVIAKKSDGTPAKADAQVSGRVDAVDFTDGVTRFRVGAVTITPADIVSVGLM